MHSHTQAPEFLHAHVQSVLHAAEKQLKMKSGFLLIISANQKIKGDSKGVNNRHMWLDSITNSGEGCNRANFILYGFLYEMYGKIWIKRNYHVRYLNETVSKYF